MCLGICRVKSSESSVDAVPFKLGGRHYFWSRCSGHIQNKIFQMICEEVQANLKIEFIFWGRCSWPLLNKIFQIICRRCSFKLVEIISDLLPHGFPDLLPHGFPDLLPNGFPKWKPSDNCEVVETQWNLGGLLMNVEPYSNLKRSDA